MAKKYVRVGTVRSDGANARIDTGFGTGVKVDGRGNVKVDLIDVATGDDRYQGLGSETKSDVSLGKNSVGTGTEGVVTNGANIRRQGGRP